MSQRKNRTVLSFVPKRLHSPCRDRNIAHAFGVIHRVREDIHDRVLGSAFLQKEIPTGAWNSPLHQLFVLHFGSPLPALTQVAFCLCVGQEPAVPPVSPCSPVGKSAGQVYLDISPPWKQQWDFKCVHTDLMKKITL